MAQSNSIEQLKNTVGKHGGLAPKNRFLMFMSVPGFIMPGSMSSYSMGLLCESVSIPGRRINVIERQAHKQATNVPAGHANQEIFATFTLTNDYFMKSIFDVWLAMISNPQTYALAYKKDIVVDIEIQQLNQAGFPVYGVKLKNAFPTAMTQLDFANASDNDYHRVQVSFVYDEMEENIITSTTAASIVAEIANNGTGDTSIENIKNIVAASGNTTASNPVTAAIENIFGATNTVIGDFVTAITGPVDQVVEVIQGPLGAIDRGIAELITSVTGPILNTIGGIAGIGNRIDAIRNTIESISSKIRVLTNFLD